MLQPISTINYQPSFKRGLNKQAIKEFARNQKEHAEQQGMGVVLGLAFLQPFSLRELLLYKLGLDLIEVYHSVGNPFIYPPCTIKAKCTNVFAWLADGARAGRRLVTKNKITQ